MSKICLNSVEARLYYEEALAIREQVLGPDHPATASSLNNLGTLSFYIGDYQTAAGYMRQALAIWERVLGPEHPQTKTARQSLVSLLDIIVVVNLALIY